MLAVLPLALFATSFLTFLTRFQQRWFRYSLSLILVAVVLLLTILSSRVIPSTFELLLWQPLGLSQSSFLLALDQIGWSYLLLAVACLLGAMIMGGIQQSHSGHQTSLATFYAGVGLIGMMAANVLTALLAWALMDLTFYAYSFLRRDKDHGLGQSEAGIYIDAFSLLLLLASALSDWRAGGDGNFLTPANTQFSIALLGAAVFIRALPKHDIGFWSQEGQRWQLSNLGFGFFPAATGCAFLARQLRSGISSDWTSIFIFLGSMGSFFAIWSLLRGAPLISRLGILLVAWGYLAAGVAAGSPIGIEAAGLLVLVLGFVLSKGEIFNSFHRVLVGTAFALSIGIPISLGGAIGNQYSSSVLLRSSPLSVLALLFGICTASVHGYQYLKPLGAEPSSWSVSERALRGLYNFGFILPFLAALFLGVRISTGLGIGGIIFFLLCLMVVLLTYFFLRPRVDAGRYPWKLVQFRIDISWLSGVVRELFKSLLKSIRSIGELLEGENAILWMLIILLMVVLLIV